MLWVACKNPFAQDFDRSKMEKAFEKLEMVVCADQFFNETVQHADIVLPVTTAFEEWNVDASYWHYWLSINQPAIKPMYRGKMRSGNRQFYFPHNQQAGAGFLHIPAGVRS